MQVKVRNIERQEVQLDIVRQVAVCIIRPAKVVEVALLAERERLVRISPIDCRLADQIDEAGGNRQLRGDFAGMLFC